MTKKEVAIYNRLSTKCHAYVKYTFPEVYKKLGAQAHSEYELGKSRRNSYQDIQRALKPRNPGADVETTNLWGDYDIPIGEPSQD